MTGVNEGGPASCFGGRAAQPQVPHLELHAAADVELCLSRPDVAVAPPQLQPARRVPASERGRAAHDAQLLAVLDLCSEPLSE